VIKATDKFHFFFAAFSLASIARNSAIIPPSSFTSRFLLAILTALETPLLTPAAMLD
jgi:hypothetical protein